MNAINTTLDVFRHSRLHPARQSQAQEIPFRVASTLRALHEPTATARPGAQGLPGMIARNPGAQALHARARAFADAGHPVLIRGGVGSGKSRLARAMHDASGRALKELRVIRSIVFPDFLASPEGARACDHGHCPELAARFAQAASVGTLIIDEIGDLSFAAQTLLLKLLSELQSPVNVIALTHMDLQNAVATGRFRSDLLHRLIRCQLILPDLDERPEDLQPLAEHFRGEISATNPDVAGFSESAFDAMHRHHWRGNLRELRNRIERGMLVAKAALLLPEDLGLPAR